MEPLADAERWRVIGERTSRPFRRAVFPQEPHVEMPVIRGSLRLLVAGRRGPGLWQIEQAVPMDARHAVNQQFGGAVKTEFLHLLGTKARRADLGHPDWQIGHGSDLVDLLRPSVDRPQIPVERKAVHRDRIKLIEEALS